MGGVGWYRTDTDILERGGALASGFDITRAEKAELKITQEKMWENYKYFIDAVMPTAEEAGRNKDYLLQLKLMSFLCH